MRHELYLLRRGLTVLAVGLVPLSAVAWLLGQSAGLASALAGAGIVVANQTVAAVSTGWARVMCPRVVAVGYAVFVARMFGVFGAFAALAAAGWAHRGLVAAGFCAALAVTLGAECWAWARGRHVPRWRLTPQAAELHGWTVAR